MGNDCHSCQKKMIRCGGSIDILDRRCANCVRLNEDCSLSTLATAAILSRMTDDELYSPDFNITSASLQQQNPGKRKRGPRRRAQDCLTCRKRKMKCDGSRPECTNCVRGGFICAGYPAQGEPSHIENEPITFREPSPSPWDNMPLAAKAIALEQDPVARRYSQHENRLDSMSNAGSSAGSVGSAASYMSFGPRKGRRVAFQKPSPDHSKYSPPSPAFKPEGEKQIYECTFCCRSFKTFFTWKRHEESAHIAQYIWTCRPDMFRFESTGSGCPVCTSSSSVLDGSPQLSCQHRFKECWEKQESERVFYRRDTFVQHLRSVHFKGSKSGERITRYLDLAKCKESSRREISASDLVCHFCGFGADSWSARFQHIRRHFENGQTMKLWIPGGPYAINMQGSTLCSSSGVSKPTTGQEILQHIPPLTPEEWLHLAQENIAYSCVDNLLRRKA
ncbi:hypothetical protein F5Y07DRAFT_285333 [Xylaria sp. FL0933]|nr:hypothetical protein F5Y07DRAFT_285333 [Xylaria sp. FL0933]